MSDNFADRMRKAAGVPTEADKQAEAEKLAAEEAAWQRDEPKRQAALAYYKDTISPMIHACATLANKVAQEAPGFSITEAQYHQLDAHTLARRSFHLQKVIQRNHLAPLRSGTTIVGSLHLQLSSTGILHIDAPNAGPQVSPKPGKDLPVQDIRQDQIEDAFVRLLAKMNG